MTPMEGGKINITLKLHQSHPTETQHPSESSRRSGRLWWTREEKFYSISVSWRVRMTLMECIKLTEELDIQKKMEKLL